MHRLGPDLQGLGQDPRIARLWPLPIGATPAHTPPNPAWTAVAVSYRFCIAAFCLLTLLVPAGAAAQTYDRAEIEMFRNVRRLPNSLARYQYLVQLMPHLSASDRLAGEQLQAFALDELGMYNQAVLAFPLRSAQPDGLMLPQPAQWKGEDALNLIARLAAERRIVMINEAHHNAHTRQLTLALLPRLRAEGLTYFAAEALGDDDPALSQRGYPVRSSGSEYLREPVYGEIVREAIRLGFVLVPYDSDSNDPRAREAEQAENLYWKVFAKHPDARLFVQAGYAHIDKARGRLGEVDPMAMQLAKLTGLDPLTVDQTQFLESGTNTSDDYTILIRRFPSGLPEVLVDRATGKPWSAMPDRYDLNVILPAALNVNTFGQTLRSVFGQEQLENVEDASHLAAGSFITLNDMQRPAWLTLGGQRQPFLISTELCRNQVPCVVGAHYVDEPDAATAADRYAFITTYSRSSLYLRPGRYRLRAWNSDGKTLSERVVTVATH